jgi:hypothetical protein
VTPIDFTCNKLDPGRITVVYHSNYFDSYLEKYRDSRRKVCTYSEIYGLSSGTKIVTTSGKIGGKRARLTISWCPFKTQIVEK